MNKKVPKIYGLVLAGGKSTRMGSDKGLLSYHGIPQQEYLYKLLENVCDSVFLSVRDEQHAALGSEFNFVIDKNEYKGPFNGILSAHSEYPEVAWLVLACDLPMIDLAALKQLSDSRNTDKLATSFASKMSGLPEPLITIWEPSGLQKAIAYLKTTESSCPRKFLINSDTELVHPSQDEVLYNANSISDYEFVKSKIATTNES
ncbi:NTP transferase domain-containing protein [Flagellimonas hymeniacidonis]|uniref:Probable molybdenum cofactor guanylyltransferase n=1 Tax=Flagellimonas hymeniacidonis TaxID=2603628 RepID=A0A5C8V3S2_9FLAO|nr:NTP transferase domain-containing protein [Flagellimonas hymeniacidonis]TXN35739.1 NTP transferase domain-containing protein [Flagellimonas hymeniacidonis]